MKPRMGRTLVGLISVLIVGASSGDAQGLINTVAGSTWSFPATPISPATNAPLGSIRGVAVDASGNVYACDFGNRRVVKITAAGSLTVVAGNGSFGYTGDGEAAITASMTFPFGVAVDTATPPNVYIADTLNHVIRKVNGSDGKISTVAGNGIQTGSIDGAATGSTQDNFADNVPATSTPLNLPSGVAVDAANPPNIYIADTLNHRIRKVAAGTGIISTVAGNGTAGFADNATATSGQFNQPSGVATDAANPPNVYIADTLNNRIRKISTGGALSTVAGTGISGNSGDNGPATNARLSNPLGVWVAGADIYVADTSNGRVRKVDVNGTITRVAGSGTFSFSGDGGLATSAALASPSGVAVSGTTIYIADTDNKRVRSVTPLTNGTINTFAGNGNFKFAGDNVAGGATSASLNFPNGVAVHASDNDVHSSTPHTFVYVADTNNNRIRKLDVSTGTISTFAGTGQFGFSGDGGPATAARLNGPSGVGVAGTDVYIADTFNHEIRKVDASGAITAVAGNGTLGLGDNALALNNAVLNQPTGVAVDVLRNIYIADKNNHRIARVTSGGIISTVVGSAVSGAGVAGFNGDTNALTSTQLNFPTGVAVDAVGANVYIADTVNQRIRKVTGASISTIAGNGTRTGSIDGAGNDLTDDVRENVSATTTSMNFPSGVAVDSAGNVYLADQVNHRLRKVNASDGTINTVAGNGVPDSSGDGGPATSASLATPIGVAIDAVRGSVYIADSSNDRIRKLFAGFISAGIAQGSPGGTARIPITLALFGGASVSSLTFGLSVVPNAGAPALSIALSFVKDTALPDPNLVDTGGAVNFISVNWLGQTNPPFPLSGALRLGEVVVPIPSGAADGQTYTVRITVAEGSLSNVPVTLSPGLDATLTVALQSYLVGDVFPPIADLNGDGDRNDGGEFGDGALTILDLIETLRVVTALVTVPAACSDRFDAMDSNPADGATRGGNGALSTSDLILTLRRVVGIDSSRPRRVSRGITPCVG